MEAILSFLDQFAESFRIVDAIDILLVSFFLYAMLAWFQRAASRGVFIGIASLVFVYVLARGLDMYLTTLAFQTLFAILLFILVVVFQEDLRRLLERVSTFQRMNFGNQQPNAFDVDGLVATVFRMSASKTGALIVLKGKEPLERHLIGGVALSGRFSKSLLLSIFDVGTPGHDGAVVIEGDRVTQFAAHLPISKNTTAIAGRGTRHSAALGLSERSDALTIVVSEERGTVAVAEAGTLSGIATASELKQRLESYMEATFPLKTRPHWTRLVVQHGRLKFLSLVIATTAWFALAYDPHTVQRTFVVPVEFRNLSEQVELDGTAPNEARVTLTGSERDFRFVDPGGLKISLDLSTIGIGYHEIAVAATNIRLPTNVTLYRIEPRIMRLYARPRKPLAEPNPNGTDGN